MGMATEKLELMTTPSDLHVLREKGFILEKIIGEGSYAKVFKATQMIDETRHSIMACKMIDTAQAPRDYLLKFLPRELDVLIRVNHPHIIHVSNVLQRRAKYFIFLRFAENGDLLDFLTQHGALPENQSRLWMRQILSGIQYIHALNIAHRDLKCENILITANYNVKITDFGFARNVRLRDRDIFSETYCGSLSYAAPEVLKGIPYLPKLADMWSIGIIMYTMLNKALPFNETSVRKLYEKQVMRKWRFRTNVVNQLSTECKQQVTMLMEPEAKARPTAGSTFNGAWIAMDQKLATVSILRLSGTKRLIVEVIRSDATDAAEEIKYLTAISDSTEVLLDPFEMSPNTMVFRNGITEIFYHTFLVHHHEELTFLEESLLKQAEEESQRKERDNIAESEVERIAELRRKARGKEGLKVLKTNDAMYGKSQSILDNKE